MRIRFTLLNATACVIDDVTGSESPTLRGRPILPLVPPHLALLKRHPTSEIVPLPAKVDATNGQPELFVFSTTLFTAAISSDR